MFLSGYEQSIGYAHRIVGQSENANLNDWICLYLSAHRHITLYHIPDDYLLNASWSVYEAVKSSKMPVFAGMGGQLDIMRPATEWFLHLFILSPLLWPAVLLIGK